MPGDLEVWVRGSQERLEVGAAVVDHYHLQRAVVLGGNLSERKQHVLGSIAREHHDGGERRLVRQRLVRRSCLRVARVFRRVVGIIRWRRLLHARRGLEARKAWLSFGQRLLMRHKVAEQLLLQVACDAVCFIGDGRA